MKDVLETFDHMFNIPEETKSRCGFADLPRKISFHDSEVVIYGVPLDLTTSFGKGTGRGPEAIRVTSARQIETFVFEENRDIQSCVKIYDLGDLRLPFSLTGNEKDNHDSWWDKVTLMLSFPFLTVAFPKLIVHYTDNRKIPIDYWWRAYSYHIMRLRHLPKKNQ